MAASRIRRLDEATINRIAAGEVVERPASVVKELVENAIDAGARRIAVAIEDGGRRRILVEDDGCGMSAEELPLAVERHATSKLVRAEELERIATLGFRGEALPSIGAVARLEILSRTPEAANAWRIRVEGGRIAGPEPAAGAPGTRVEVRDLFYATPARLKFLKSARAETTAILDVVRRLAMAHPTIAFEATSEGRRVFAYAAADASLPYLAASAKRLADVLGAAFLADSIEIDVRHDGRRLVGRAGLPTHSRGNALQQYLFVNGRTVRDRLLVGAVRAAYQDLLPRDRHPVVALHLELPPEDVDINVHPAKTEVRFKDAGRVRALIVTALREALATAGPRTAATLASGLRVHPGHGGGRRGYGRTPAAASPPAAAAEAAAGFQAPLDAPLPPAVERPEGGTGPVVWRDPRAAGEDGPSPTGFPLGAARAQLFGTYILAETEDGLVIVDQHAAHERLTYERMKRELAEGGVKRQLLLIPEVVELPPGRAGVLLERREEFARLGLVLEPFGDETLVVRAVPALIAERLDVPRLIRDLADDLEEMDAPLALEERLMEVLADRACRSSVRAGRRLNLDEMNALLREMEATPHSSQCNHGRPTHVTLTRAEIERLFGRK